MELILVLALIVGVLSLAAIKKQERNRANRFNKRGHYNAHKDYLDDVKKATKKRFEEEQSQQEYKNNIKRNYL